MRKVSTMTGLLLAAGVSSAFAADMPMAGPSTMAKATGYHFALASPAKSSGKGKSIVAVTLIRDGKPVTGAIVIQSRADMGAIGMAAMTAPIKALGEQPPGTYRFEVENGPVWNKADDWSLSFSAKVQGVTQTVNGSVTVRLTP
jgi:hypothetical protein